MRPPCSRNHWVEDKKTQACSTSPRSRPLQTRNSHLHVRATQKGYNFLSKAYIAQAIHNEPATWHHHSLAARRARRKVPRPARACQILQPRICHLPQQVPQHQLGDHEGRIEMCTSLLLGSESYSRSTLTFSIRHHQKISGSASFANMKAYSGSLQWP